MSFSQPQAAPRMHLAPSPAPMKQGGSKPERCQEGPSGHRCPSQRLHRHLKRTLPALLICFSLLCLASLSVLGLVQGQQRQDQLLVKRQQVPGDGTGSTGDTAGDGDGGAFVNDHLYLVVFVGLLLCLIAAIFVSAWCCKGAFKNPLCCPCYLCACCGCLGLLECLSCGLCAAGGMEMLDEA